MKFTTLFLTALLGFAIADDSDKKEHKKDKKKQELTGDKKQCFRMAKLTHIVETANNQTRMDRIQSQHPDRAQKIKDDAARVGPELSGLQKNSTLVQYCGSYNAHEKLVKQCRTLKHGERLSNKLKNNTAVEESARRKNKSPDQIKSRWQQEIDHINKLKSNSTLVDQCKKIKTTKDSKKGDKGDKKDKGKAEKQKSAAAQVQVAGTGAFVVGLSLLIASLML